MAENQRTSFRKLMELRDCGHDTFESVTPAWPPGSLPSVGKRAFGGHVYAQAAWAASQTVTGGLYIHNVTGHFLLPGMVDVPFIYHVKRIRDGGVYSLRSVEVFQQSQVAGQGKLPCFISTVSFKGRDRHENTIDYGHQNIARDHIDTEYQSVLGNRKIEEHPLAPRADANWPDYSDESKDDFPGCEMRKVDMRAYNGVAVPGGGPQSSIISRWRQLTFYRIEKEFVRHRDEDNLNLHAAAQLYASDRNSLFLVLRALGYDDNPAFMGSLLHTVVFHGPSHAYRMLAEDGSAKWFVQEAWTSSSGDNRVCHNSRLWDYTSGTVIGTTTQDGMMRMPQVDRKRPNL